MKAFVIADQSAGSIRSVEVAAPSLSSGELLVRMHAVGVGIHDSYYLPPNAGPLYPIGIEGAGIVEGVGADVTGYLAGDRIAFVSSMQPKGGTWAETAVVDTQSLILPVPSELGFVEAAAIPVAGNTVLRAFAALGSLPDDASIFIAGGSGAIGTLAIQIARQKGWRVAASASTHNHDFMRSLGAELTVDYHKSAWIDDIQNWMPGGVIGAIAIQPGTTVDSMHAVHSGGTVVTVSGDMVEPERGITVSMVDYQVDVREGLVRLMDAVATNELHLEIERIYPFESAAEALARVQTRHTRGKLVLSLSAR